MASDLWRISDQYRGAPLDPADCDPDPIAQFKTWFQVAHSAGLPKVNAMTLATADEHGRPHARIVLLKDADEQGFVFFTNYDSNKSKQLAASPYAALVIYWDPLDRQVRIEGRVERVSDAESDAYFATRPIGSQLGAIASPQSQPIPSRKLLEDRVAELAADLGDSPPIRPANWGGFRVIPDLVEFWQGQPSRLHDRVRYFRQGSAWVRDRLAP
jgi:pyridoxamine 5'-phosphate oxidase